MAAPMPDVPGRGQSLAARFGTIILLADTVLPLLQSQVSWGWGTGEVPMFARIDATQILFLAAATILVVSIAYLF
jgi:hypothetical protein